MVHPILSLLFEEITCNCNLEKEENHFGNSEASSKLEVFKITTTSHNTKQPEKKHNKSFFQLVSRRWYGLYCFGLQNIVPRKTEESTSLDRMTPALLTKEKC